MYWLIKREFWEHKGMLVWTPVLTALATMLVIFYISLPALLQTPVPSPGFGGQPLSMLLCTEPSRDANSDPDTYLATLCNVNGLNLQTFRLTLTVVFSAAIAGFLVLSFYLAGSLHRDRDDRSILLWKSLPITDRDTVISKVLIALLIGPVIYFGVAALVDLLGIGLYAIVQLVTGHFDAHQWYALADTPLTLFAAIRELIYIPLFVLWALPTAGVYVLVSAWSRVNPMFWIAMVPAVPGIAIGTIDYQLNLITDHLAYWRNIAGRVFLSNFPNSWVVFDNHEYYSQARPLGVAANLPELLKPLSDLLGSANLWLGVVAGVALIAAAIHKRRWSDEL